jgi:ribosome-binding factor A
MSRRQERVNDLLQEELSRMILRELKDPRLAHGLISITEVEVSPDLRHAIVFISHLGEESDRAGIMEGLRHSAHYLHSELVHRLKMKRVPELDFRFDPTIERGARLASLINQVAIPPPSGPEAQQPG